MSRIVSVWLPRWPVLRFLAAQSRNPAAELVDPAKPFILASEATGGPRIAACNPAAEAEGVVQGDRLADARAKAGMLQVRFVDPAADDMALRKLTLWATRYTPAVSPWGNDNKADGFFLDITGAGHLFGGEQALLADLSWRLKRAGFPARLAVADTPGAAWALSRHVNKSIVVLPSGREVEGLNALPVEALRLSHETCVTLRRLGFKRIGQLIGQPRAPFAGRFERELLQRVDQALGRVSEPLTYITAPPIYHSLRHLMEPVFTRQAVVAVALRLMRDLGHALMRDGMGARVLRLALYRVDGETTLIDISLSRPTRSAEHVAKLVDLKLERFESFIDSGFGFEALGLSVLATESMDPQQAEFATFDDGDKTERRAELVDRLKQRLGPRSVWQLKPLASHVPERAESAFAATGDLPQWPQSDDAQLRPLFLLPEGEAAEVMALVPEGPPRNFRWRGETHRIAWTQGPERIAAEWWRDGRAHPTRDYYIVENQAGRRFWLYREGLYEREPGTPRWFVHGVFA
jgi:protein ImuB